MPTAPHAFATSRVTAVLGPTNTGKTHFAIERMLAHRSGMIGLPLRLLAREVYDKIVRIKGAAHAALITGEEKIVPPEAKYFVCTVEAMPLDLGTAFLAIDEIQLCADPERGHVFTDRLLNARGEEETVFLGADTMRGAIQKFVPRTYFISRSRFSDLAYTGQKKLTRLPRRSAVVGFSAEDVYGIAELIRRQRGGAAVVLGALSPRTRNAQVQLYQNGDVDFLVATDAIGMGLNMDVDHVAFAALDKFDGVGVRPLKPEEIGQIAGRAGRHMNDGTFGVTAEAEPLDEDVVARVEGHRYDPVRVLQWRNAALDFHSLDGLIASLDEPPPARGLVKARPASDLIALRHLSGMDEVRELTRAPAGVRRLWEVCQLPDFRKLNDEEHARLVHTIFMFLMSDDGVLPDDWLARQIGRLDVTEGDVATLSGRLAQIRTWTYATHRASWMRDSGHWQEVTRAVEDRLSDALHEQLTQRFIDRRTSVLMKHLREDQIVALRLDDSGGVVIGGEAVGKLEGFRFAPDPRVDDKDMGGVHGRTLRAAALKGLEGEYVARAGRLAAADDKAFSLSEHGRIWWDGAIVARLTAGASALAPGVALVADENLKGEQRESVQRRLDAWLEARIATRLAPLIALRNAADAKPGTPGAIGGFARGIAHQLCEGLGSLDRANVALPDKLGELIGALKSFGVWIGKRTIYLPKLLKPEAASLLGLLWGVQKQLDKLPAPPQAGLTSFETDGSPNREFLAATGFRVVAGRAIRFDMLERLEDTLEKGAAEGATADVLMPKLVSLLGIGNDELRAILDALGWRIVEVADAGAGVRSVWRHAPVRTRERGRERKGKGKHEHGKHGQPAPLQVKRGPPSAASLEALAAKFKGR
ncbi:MAG: disulfide oxidoreductase [Alphaproteobacteria bacterium]|nr:disulfide oxidoreductase [Alphaproteobacteria bacterium]